jgi:8-oxo-dGTP pyrophosphatase MutT (NUDIX family)
VQSPGCWAGTSGAIDHGETAEQAALRELSEELSGIKTAVLGSGTVTACEACGWTFTGFLGRVELDQGRLPVVRIRDHGETTEIRWVPVDGVGELPNLHPGLAATWESLRAELEEVAS